MQNINEIANGRSKLLSELSAEFYYGDDRLYHAKEMAPAISRADMVLGSFEAWQPVELTADQLGEIMKPNYIDINNKPYLIEFKIEKHELHAIINDELVAAMELYGVSQNGVERRVTRILTQKLKAMAEFLTINAMTNSATYENGLVNSSALTWGGSSGTAIGDIRDAIATLELNSVPEFGIAIAASPAIWQAIRDEVGDKLRPQTAAQGYLSVTDAAGYFGAKGVNFNFVLNSSFVMGSNVVIGAVDESVTDITRSAWRTVFGGKSGNPEPTVIRYQEAATAHRQYSLACYLDYSIVPTGAGKGVNINNVPGNVQRMAYLFSNVSSGL